MELVGVFDDRDGFLRGLKRETTLLHSVANLSSSISSLATTTLASSVDEVSSFSGQGHIRTKNRSYSVDHWWGKGMFGYTYMWEKYINIHIKTIPTQLKQLNIKSNKQ